MKYRAIDYAQALSNTLSHSNVNHRDVSKNFWRLLLKNRQTRLIQPILKDFCLINQLTRGVLIIETPFRLSSHTKQMIMRRFSYATGKKLATTKEVINVNQTLGIRGQTATHEFDWTAAKTLKQLEWFT